MQQQSNKTDFNGQHIYAGIDVHLRSWKVTVLTEELTVRTFSQNPRPELLHQYMTRNFPNATYHTAYEAGFCGFWIHNKLKLLGIDSIVVNPADIPTTNKEVVNKTDQRDSKKIARLLRSGLLDGIHVLSLKTLEDRSLVRTRTTMVRDMTRIKNRIKAFLYFHGIEFPEQFKQSGSHWSKRFVLWLRDIELTEYSAKKSLSLLVDESEFIRSMILEATRAIRDLSQSESYARRVMLLQSIPGLGMLTSMVILTEIESINRFPNFDKFCSFIGLIPSTNSSGESEKTGELTHRGNNFLKGILVECAWIAARRDAVLNKSYSEYCKRMEPNKAIIRIARKLLSRIRFVLKNNQVYVYQSIN
ncbi:MAG: IS110 family transposase [Bacteroidetes bacterium]|jgi:transposase|nr:IS110 family transposase [Bacteroidota bacterium]MBT4410403.1 IS110 family transposase [Bacteroidota bacterium]